MKRTPIVRMAMMAVLATTLASGCSKKPQESQAVLPSGGSSDFSETDVSEPISGPVRVPELKTLYFDFDRYNIRADQQPTAKANVGHIDKHPEWKQIVLEGNTDERGTEEYNLALGDKRANAVADYYIKLGVPSSKIVTVSFGASRPAVQGHDDSAWKFNRRVDTLVNK
jgi:peptidoglycan-associated lipoprotein